MGVAVEGGYGADYSPFEVSVVFSFFLTTPLGIFFY